MKLSVNEDGIYLDEFRIPDVYKIDLIRLDKSEPKQVAIYLNLNEVDIRCTTVTPRQTL